MKLLQTIFLTLTLLGLAQGLSTSVFAASAGEISTRFAIDKMTCTLCPITVRKSMERVPGVKQVEVDYESKVATVIFDPTLTNKKTNCRCVNRHRLSGIDTG